MCCARPGTGHVSQICDLAAATFIVPMPVEKGQAVGEGEFLTRTVPVPLAKTPATQVVPQDVRAKHADTATALRSIFRMPQGRYCMGYSELRHPIMRGRKFCVGFYAREGFGTRREIFHLWGCSQYRKLIGLYRNNCHCKIFPSVGICSFRSSSIRTYQRSILSTARTTEKLADNKSPHVVSPSSLDTSKRLYLGGQINCADFLYCATGKNGEM